MEVVGASLSEAYLKPNGTPTMELFAKIVNA